MPRCAFYRFRSRRVLDLSYRLNLRAVRASSCGIGIC